MYAYVYRERTGLLDGWMEFILGTLYLGPEGELEEDIGAGARVVGELVAGVFI